MKKLSLIVSLVIACCSFNANAAFSKSEIIAGQKKAATENIEMLRNKIMVLKKLQSASSGLWHNGCGPEPEEPKSTCVPNCSVRSASGSCLYYTSDFCGPNASCSENCEVRGSNGDCLYYGSDICD